MNREALGAVAELNDPATAQEIREALGRFGVAADSEYAELLACSNGLFANDRLKIYSTDEVEERNTTYEVGKYLPDWVMIGDDSGGYGVFLRAPSPTSPVYLFDLGGLFPGWEIEQAPSLREWVRSGFPLRY